MSEYPVSFYEVNVLLMSIPVINLWRNKLLNFVRSIQTMPDTQNIFPCFELTFQATTATNYIKNADDQFSGMIHLHTQYPPHVYTT